MKIDRHGQAKILSQSEIQLLFSQGLLTDRDREALLLTAVNALFGICLDCCCRINEAYTLNVNDFYSKGKVRPELLIRNCRQR
jgi:integrase/recombinase XerD